MQQDMHPQNQRQPNDKDQQLKGSSEITRVCQLFDPFAGSDGHKVAWRNLTVKIAGKVINDNLSGEVAPGQLTAVMGHSGSGK